MTDDPDLSLQDGDLTLVPTSGGPGAGSGLFTGFAVHQSGDRIGTVALRDEGETDVLSIRWNLARADLGTAVRAVGLVVAHAFGALGVQRLEARIPVDRDDQIRVGSICGLRREGIVRTAGNSPDHVLLGRLVTDPPLTTPDGFIAILNAGLPTKRVIGQGIWRDRDGRVLLCELTYKAEWDLPGGVVEVGEAPAVGLAREIGEELGVAVDVGRLITVNWLPAWRGWDDACVFVFELGVAADDLADQLVLQRSEIRAVHWCDAATVRERATAATIELLDAIADAPVPAYREAPLSPA